MDEFKLQHGYSEHLANILKRSIAAALSDNVDIKLLNEIVQFPIEEKNVAQEMIMGIQKYSANGAMYRPIMAALSLPTSEINQGKTKKYEETPTYPTIADAISNMMPTAQITNNIAQQHNIPTTKSDASDRISNMQKSLLERIAQQNKTRKNNTPS